MTGKEIINDLTEQKKHLSSVIQETKVRLRKAPEGQVRIAKHGKGHQFYLRTDPTDPCGKYIPIAERKTAIALVQKKYDTKVLQTAQKQLDIIERFLKGYHPEGLKKHYEILSSLKKEETFAAEIPDEVFLGQWEAYQYPRKGFDKETPEHYSSKGERVRSKSEVMIADALNNQKIPYRYECPIMLGNRILHPDFTILRIGDRKTLYWEHLGKMDDAGYCRSALLRIRMYETSGIYPGIDLILTMETSDIPINLSIIKRMIHTYCM